MAKVTKQENGFDGAARYCCVALACSYYLLSEGEKNLYLDEAQIDCSATLKKCWQTVEVKVVLADGNTGNRPIVCHACSAYQQSRVSEWRTPATDK
jgi:hypothetical protein